MKNLLIPAAIGLAVAATGYIFCRKPKTKEIQEGANMAAVVTVDNETVLTNGNDVNVLPAIDDKIEVYQERKLNGHDAEIGWKYCDVTDRSFGCIRLKQGDIVVRDVLFDADDESSTVFVSSATDHKGNIYCVGGHFTRKDGGEVQSNPIVTMFDKDFNVINSKVITHPNKKAEQLSIVSYVKDTNEIVCVGVGSKYTKGDCMCIAVINGITFDVTEFNLYPHPQPQISDFL